MKKRDFIKSLAAFGVASNINLFSQNNNQSIINNPNIKANFLKPGDSVGVIAPATSVTDPDDIGRAKEALEYFKLNPIFGKNTLKASGYKTRTIAERIDDLHSLFANKEVKAIFNMRGGYGSGQILDSIDYDLIKKNPKIFIGYSDITALHLAIHKMTGLVTFHGPVLLSSYSPFTLNYFNKAMFSSNPIGEIKNSQGLNNIRKKFPTRTITSGKASGNLIGGNLSLISSLMGTKYEIETKGKILFLEDVGEEPYRVDRMMNQLKIAGKLKDAAGIVFGVCSDCNFEGLKSSRVWDWTLGEVLDFYLKDLNIPVFYGLNFGHTDEQATLPIGIKAELDADLGILNIIESATV